MKTNAPRLEAAVISPLEIDEELRRQRHYIFEFMMRKIEAGMSREMVFTDLRTITSDRNLTELVYAEALELDRS